MLSLHYATRAPELLAFAAKVAAGWVRRYPTEEVPSAFAWYDMAVGLRGYRLAYLLDAAARDRVIGDEIVSLLLASVRVHARVLAGDRLFAKHSNHGMYFAAGQAALCRRFSTLPGMAAGWAQGQQRLASLLDRHFTAEDVHAEHSPDYHRMVLELVLGLVGAGLIRDPAVVARCERIRATLAWFILPNERLVTFGDSEYRRLPEYAARGGAGAVESAELKVFPKSGYAIVRQRGNRERSGTCLAQTCAFHSRVHRHADDLSFVWFDRGRRILIDPGRFGYLGRTEVQSDLWKDGFWYADPRRIYVESTRAHNTVQIDGRNFARAGVVPYGSALLAWGGSGGAFYAVSRVRHWQTIVHTRILVLAACP